jgi:hypothetical protein
VKPSRSRGGTIYIYPGNGKERDAFDTFSLQRRKKSPGINSRTVPTPGCSPTRTPAAASSSWMLVPLPSPEPTTAGEDDRCVCVRGRKQSWGDVLGRRPAWEMSGGCGSVAWPGQGRERDDLPSLSSLLPESPMATASAARRKEVVVA